MGGRGSSRWPGYYRRLTVEDCFELELSRLLRLSGAVPGRVGSYRYRFGIEGTPAGTRAFEFTVNLEDVDQAHILIAAEQSLDDVIYHIELSATMLPKGGIRWWMHCPGKNCGRRSAKLYLPPGETRFLCRACHDLTYESCQQNRGKFKTLVARIEKMLTD